MGLFLLQLVDVPVAKIVRVANEFLAVEASHHSVLEGLFVSEELTENCTELQVIFA